MKGVRTGSWIAAAAIALAPLGAAAVLETAEEIEACVRKNMPERSSRQKITMRAHSRTGAVTETEAEIFWREFDDGRSRALLRFSDPPDMRGAALLLIEGPDRNDMFMYVPELHRVRRVSGRMLSGSMFGTDFTYEEFERLQGAADDVSSTVLPAAELDGRAVYVVSHEVEPQEGRSTEKAVSYVDQERCVPLKVESYEKGDQLRRILTADPASLEQLDGRWIPRRLTMRDLRDDTHTELTVDEIEIGIDLPDKLFTQRELERGS